MLDAKKEVQRIAKLARLQLTPEEEEKYGEKFAGLIDHFAKIQGLNTEGVEPTVYPFAASNVLREDKEVPSLAPDALLRNAPERQENFYKVPKVIEG